MVEYDDDDDDDDEVVVVEAEVLLLYCVDEGCCKPVGIRTGATMSRLCGGVSCPKKTVGGTKPKPNCEIVGMSCPETSVTSKKMPNPNDDNT